MKQICRKILITEYLGYRYLTYHHPQHLHLVEKTEKGTIIINTVLWYNRYICNSKLILPFQQPSESTMAFHNAAISVVKKCFTVAFFLLKAISSYFKVSSFLPFWIYWEEVYLLYQVTKISFFVLFNRVRSMRGLLSSLSFFFSRNKNNKGD